MFVPSYIIKQTYSLIGNKYGRNPVCVCPLEHFQTTQSILTKLSGDIHGVRGSCIVYIARAARVHYGCAQRANVIIRFFLAGGIRASISRPLHRSLPNLVETFTRSGGFVYAILCTQRAGVTGLHSVRTLFCRFFLIKLILNQTWCLRAYVSCKK